MRAALVLWLCGVAVATAAPAKQDRPELLVLDVAAQGTSPEEAAAVTDATVQALTRQGLFHVRSSRDVRDVLAAERQRELLGQCVNGEAGCAVDLGSLTGARFMLTGTLSRVSNAYQLSLQTLDTQKGQPVARSLRLASDLETLVRLVPWIAAEATGSPLPPPKSRVVPYSLLSAGSALLLGGGVVGLMALSRQAVLNQELCPSAPSGGRCTGVNLQPLTSYRADDRALGTQKTIALGLLGAGVLAGALGFGLLPPPEQGVRVALVPSGSGAAVVGVWR